MAARLFSLSIPFNGENHAALVSIRQQGCDLVCFVRYIDQELQHILSVDSLVFGLMDGLKQPKNLPSRQAEKLVRNTTTAISKYLQAA
jgi:hypothetical protein